MKLNNAVKIIIDLPKPCRKIKDKMTSQNQMALTPRKRGVGSKSRGDKVISYASLLRTILFHTPKYKYHYILEQKLIRSRIKR